MGGAGGVIVADGRSHPLLLSAASRRRPSLFDGAQMRVAPVVAYQRAFLLEGSTGQLMEIVVPATRAR